MINFNEPVNTNVAMEAHAVSIYLVLYKYYLFYFVVGILFLNVIYFISLHCIGVISIAAVINIL
ncbi:hypothetical protein Avbf_18870 [Armadillidium vulgare]|nr:hypothetical protein Avbf_18870 [Armadillidium vulgare]